MPIWAKLGLIILPPILATVVVALNDLVDKVDTVNSSDRTRVLSSLVKESGTLVDFLQNERAAAVMYLAADTDQDRQGPAATFAEVSKSVDTARGAYSLQRGALQDLDPGMTDLLGSIDTGLFSLNEVRTEVTDRKVRITDIAPRYQVLISQLLDIRDRAAQIAGSGDLGDGLRAASAIAQEKEFLSEERIVVHRAFDQAALNPDLRNNFIAMIVGQEQAQHTFNSVAAKADIDQYNSTVTGPALRKSTNYQGVIGALADANLSNVGFTPQEWDQALKDHAALLRNVEKQLDVKVEATAADLRDAVTQQILVRVGILIAVLLVAFFAAWVVARSMARSLRELRHGALSIAQFGLPQAVARLRDPSLSSQLSPVQVAHQIAEPLPVRSKDEFGQVTEAFNAVHLEAVRTAAEQAALRSSVATMFVNLARRSQILVDRLIGHLDRLERGEEDPDRLAELFQLDHLATRMRRNDENLLVLAGADSTRVQREPAALLDVLRAAQSEVEHYTRIEFGVVDRDIEVAAHAVNDLVHLIAELFDNATAFSPPDSTVMVEARRVGDRAVLFVEDHGIGISPDMLADINEKLATPPMVDVAVSRMMGLVVVARLAARHGVKVELRSSTERGIIADVTLPTAVLVPRALAGRSAGPVAQGGPAAIGGSPRTPTGVPSRSPFGPPLALEAGSGTGSVPAAASSRMFDSRPGDTRPTSPAPMGLPPITTPPPAAPTATPSRAGMPAWSDLTGAEGNNGTRVNGDPLPQRRGFDFDRAPQPEPEREDDYYGSSIPRQGSGPEQGYVPPAAFPAEVPFSTPPYSTPGAPISAVPVSAVPVSAEPVSATPAPSAPPVWPPVAEPSYDVTGEMPRIRDDYPVVNPAAYADETMELPIFRELESAWFTTRRAAVDNDRSSTPTAGQSDPTITAQFAAVDVDDAVDMRANVNGRNGGLPKAGGMSVGVDEAVAGAYAGGWDRPGGDVPAPYRPTWQTVADDGWAAASAAADAASSEVNETTMAGLPKRTPMAQLVPGGVDRGAATVQRRTPEGVRGLLSAYHRGVQRGRTQNDDIPGSTEAGSQSGKEQEA